MKFVRWFRSLMVKDPFAVADCSVVRRRDGQVMRVCKNQEAATADAAILNNQWRFLSNQ